MMRKRREGEDIPRDEARLARRFEENRDRLRAVAFRMVGSVGEAEDVVQEAWLRLSRADTGRVENLGGWLTTVVSRVALDTLRARRSRRDEHLGERELEKATVRRSETDPESELLLAESVGLAMLVVLDRLTPAERLAFVLHDLFDLPFEEIAPIVGRTPVAARQLASRARRRVRGTLPAPGAETTGAEMTGADAAVPRGVVEAYMAAARGGDLAGLLAVLDPEVVLRTDGKGEAPLVTQGAEAVARRALSHRRGLFAEVALIGGEIGILVAPGGRLARVLRFRLLNGGIAGGRIAEIEVIADPARLAALDIAVLDIAAPVTSSPPIPSSL